MNLSFEKDKYALSQLVLLVIFAVGLSVSYMLVMHRKRIVMSEPIVMPAGGVSVSLPNGNGWKSNLEWKHSAFSNDIITESKLFAGRHLIGIVKCSYKIAPAHVSFEQVLKYYTDESKSESLETGEIQQDVLTVDCAKLTDEHGIADLYFGWCLLPSGRTINIEVQTPGDEKLTNKVFNTVIESLQFSYDDRMVNGREHVERFKSIGMAEAIEDETGKAMQRVYLVNKYNKSFKQIDRGIGFVIEKFQKNKNLKGIDSINASTLYFLSGGDGWSGSGLFVSDDKLDEYHNQKKVTALNGQPLSQVKLDYVDGELNLFRLDDHDYEKVYKPSDAGIPELFIDSFARYYLESGEEIVVDIVFPEGRIAPAILTLAEPINGIAKIGAAEYLVKITVLDSLNTTFELYFDKNKQIISKVEKSADQIFVLEKTDVSVLMKLFSNWRDDIMNILGNR